jgi:4-hydroxy-tetrahydrodipicolinate synthase
MSLPKLYTALITPFDQSECVDYISLNNLVLDHLKKNVSFVLFGTTGECPTLTQQERLNIIEYVTHIVDPYPEYKKNIMIGVGGNNTKECIDNILSAKTFGYTLFMVTTPYYNKPSQQGMIAHFQKIANTYKSDRFIMYNVPGRTNVNLLPESVKIIVDSCPNYIGIKEASGDIGQMIKIIKTCNDRFYLYCGDDSLVISAMSIGAYGLISVISNTIPETMNNICINPTNNMKLSNYLHLFGLMELLFVEPNPSPIKYLCMLMQQIRSDTVRLPLVPIQSSDLKSKLNEYCYQLKNKS